MANVTKRKSAGRPRGEAKYAKNPFRANVIKHTVSGTRMIYSSPTENDTFAAVSRNTGEDLGNLAFGKRVKTDKTQFMKLYADGVKMFLGLKNPGIKVFMLIYDILMSNDNYQADTVDLVYNMLEDDIRDKIGKTTFYKGIKELKDVNFLAPTLQEGKFWINADYVFRGDRLTLVNEYIIADNEEKLSNITPLETEMEEAYKLELKEMNRAAYEAANETRLIIDKLDTKS